MCLLGPWPPTLGDRPLSKLIETKADFQELAGDRLVEAKALLDLGKWDGAYYLAGYAVELALKACIIKMLMETDAFPNRKFSDDCYIHDVKRLLELAKLEGPRRTAMDANPVLARNWEQAKDWSEQKRYHRIGKHESEGLYTAIADGQHGVFTWIKSQW
jgi:hypothetical protein